ncbi:hypothetical protein V6Z12_D13G051700 [Gossypium hirsutum]
MTDTSGIIVSKEKLMDEAHSTDYSLVLDNDGWTCFLLRARKRAMQNSIFLQPLFQNTWRCYLLWLLQSFGNFTKNPGMVLQSHVHLVLRLLQCFATPLSIVIARAHKKEKEKMRHRFSRNGAYRYLLMKSLNL